MSDLASRTDRFLGGRPPYGYRLTAAGPHPNPGRAASGQRAHRLVPDEVTAPVVREIFQGFVGGAGVRAIAQRLTDAGIPSPSAYDPARNSHRDPRGWAFSAVRAILANDVYTGRRVWAKQRKFEELLDPEDVAAGNRTHLRWRPEEEWIRPELKTHPALIEADLYAAARGRLASPEPRVRKARSSAHAYPLRGILFCSICGRRMEGTWRKAKTGETGRVLYRCAVRRNRALTEDFPDHPKTLYLREDVILEPLDRWIASITTADALATHQCPSTRTPPSDLLKAKLAEMDRKIASLIEAVEAGADLPQITEQLNRRARERSGLEAELRALPRERLRGATELHRAMEQLGGMAKILATADSSAREKIYNSLGVRLEYDHAARRITVNATDACVHNRVRRGT
jgi:site-specific DNA recombinase